MQAVGRIVCMAVVAPREDRDFACEKFLEGRHFFCSMHGLGYISIG
jgi:hypothetical protein